MFHKILLAYFMEIVTPKNLKYFSANAMATTLPEPILARCHVLAGFSLNCFC